MHNHSDVTSYLYPSSKAKWWEQNGRGYNKRLSLISNCETWMRTSVQKNQMKQILTACLHMASLKRQNIFFEFPLFFFFFFFFFFLNSSTHFLLIWSITQCLKLVNENQQGYVLDGGGVGGLRKLAYIRLSSSEMTLNLCWMRSSHNGRGRRPLYDRRPLQKRSIQMWLLPGERSRAEWLDWCKQKYLCIWPFIV